MAHSVNKSVITYLILASIFITGEGFEILGIKFYWYYPFYLLFVAYGILEYHKVSGRVGLVLLGISVYSMLTYQGNQLLVVKQLVNIVFSVLVFYYLICFENGNSGKIFLKYIKVSKVVAVIGFIQVLLFLFDLGTLYLSCFPFLQSFPVSFRLQSVTQEPSYFAFTFAPVVFLSLNNLFYNKNYLIGKYWSGLFVFAYLLTQSGMAYIGLLLMLLVLYFKRFTYLKLGLALFAFIGIFSVGLLFYHNIKEIKNRVDDTAWGLSRDFFEGENYRQVNLSTFALLTNYTVTKLSLEENALTGYGLGNHEVVYDRYTPVSMKKFEYYSLNRQDANSLALRLLTETGLIGFGLFCLFVFNYKVRFRLFFSPKQQVLWVINTGIFILIFLALIRNGNYTVNGKILFFLLYYFAYLEIKKTLKTPETETVKL